MTTRPWFRSAALFLLAPMLVAVIAYDVAWWFSDVTGAGDGYVVKIVSQAQPALSLGYVFVAASGAAAGLAFRRTGLSDVPSSRWQAEIVLRHLRPTLFLGLICWLATVAVSGAFADAVRLSLEAAPIVLAQLLGVLAWSTVGFALGISRLGPASLALVPFLCFFVFGFVETIPFRFGAAISGGDLQTCCTVSSTIAAESVIANALFYVALLCGAMAVLARHRAAGGVARPYFAIGGAACGVFAIIAGSLSPYPALEPRQGQPPCTIVDETTVCLWVEQSAGVHGAAEAIADVSGRLRRQGVDVPTTITGQIGVHGTLEYRRTPTSAPVAESLVVQSLTSLGAPCGDFDGTVPADLLKNYDVISAWLYRAADLDYAPIVQVLEDGQLTTWDALNSLDPEEQVEWVNRTLAAYHECAEAGPELPSTGR